MVKPGVRVLLWGATALVNTAGLAQVAYFLIGRRRST